MEWLFFFFFLPGYGRRLQQTSAHKSAAAVDRVLIWLMGQEDENREVLTMEVHPPSLHISWIIHTFSPMPFAFLHDENLLEILNLAPILKRHVFISPHTYGVKF